MNTRHVSALAGLVSFGWLLGIVSTGCSKEPRDLEPCYGFSLTPSIAVHLVEPATDTGSMYVVSDPDWGLPSCATFDGVAAGHTYTFSNVGLDGVVRSDQCSLPVADVTGPGIGALSTVREDVAEPLLVATRRGRLLEYGPATQARSVAGCSGVWSLATFPYGLVAEHELDRQDNAGWADGLLYDTLGTGSDAPVIVVRHFRLDEGATCAALPVGVTECVDAWSGYYAAAP